MSGISLMSHPCNAGALRMTQVPILVCLGINLLILSAVANYWPAYLTDRDLISNPDARHYITLGRNLLLHGHYSRCENPPYDPDMLRTPVFPVVAGGLEFLAGPGAIYLFSILTHVCSCVVLFMLTRSAFGQVAAFGASIFLAADLMLAVFNFQALSDTLFVLLILASAVFLVPEMTAPLRQTPNAIHLVWGGLLLGLGTLTRPASLYLPLLCVGVLMLRGLARHQVREGIWKSLLFLLTFGALVAPWIVRNYFCFSVPKLTNVDTTNLVYFVGAGGYQLRHGVSLEEAQRMISQEFSLPSYAAVQNPWISTSSLAGQNQQLRMAVPQVLSKYPGSLAASIVLGVGKASVSHNVGELARLWHAEWKAPGKDGLLRLKREAVEELLSNGPILCAAFAWQMCHIGLSLPLAALGIYVSFRSSVTRRGSCALLLIIGYFYLTIAMFGFEAYYRCRIPVLPFLYAFSGMGISTLFARFRKHKQN